jgi:hypothetical protein
MLGSAVAEICRRHEEGEKYEQNYSQQTWVGKKDEVEA